MPDALPPHRHQASGVHGGAGDARARLGRSLRRFALAAAVLLVVGVGAGIVFGRSDPQRAARLVVAELTVTEDHVGDAPGPDPDLPTSGSGRGPVRCGVADVPLTPEEQVAVLAAGVVLVQHPTDLREQDRAAVAELGARDRVLIAPNPALDGREHAVVATAWRHRMALRQLDVDLLGTFVTGHADRSPAPRACGGRGARG